MLVVVSALAVDSLHHFDVLAAMVAFLMAAASHPSFSSNKDSLGLAL